MIDTSNNKVFPCQYSDIGPATGALVPVRKKGGWGFADRKGSVLFLDRYDQAWEMLEGRARVRNGELFGAIDSTGREVVPLKYTSLQHLPHGYLLAGGPEGVGLLRSDGTESVALVYTAVDVLSPKLAKVQRNDAFGYIDLGTGRFIWREEGLLETSE